MPPLIHRVCEDIRSSADEIVDLWEDRTRQEPWLRLPDDARIDHIPELLDALLDAVLCTPDPETSRRRVLRLAALHGRGRAREGFDDRILYKEYHILRACVWAIVENAHPGEVRAIEVISRLDMAITIATTGSLHGFHDELTEEGDGSAGFDQLVQRVLDSGRWPPPLGDG